MAAFLVQLPKLAMTTDEATPIAWLAEDGAHVNEGEGLYRLEADKVETDIEAGATGTVHWTATLAEAYPVGTVIGEIVLDD
jgi:pyruvate/2-oxoglutarate dehydrogenase complex dihydrolipoamide acyltransferase (E2) component